MLRSSWAGGVRERLRRGGVFGRRRECDDDALARERARERWLIGRVGESVGELKDIAELLLAHRREHVTVDLLIARLRRDIIAERASDDLAKPRGRAVASRYGDARTRAWTRRR